MSPKDSWMQLARNGIVHFSHHNGSKRRDEDPTPNDYRGIPISHNIPVVDSELHLGRTILTFSLL